MNLSRKSIDTPSCQVAYAFFDFDFRVFVYAVFGIRADNVDQINTFIGQGRFHDVSSLFLNVSFTTVGDGGTMIEIDSPVRTVVPMP